MIRFGMGKASIIYICQVVETNRIGYESIAFPLRNRITHPSGRCLFRESAAIRKNLAEVSLILEKNDRHCRCLDNLEWSRDDEKTIGHSMRQAASRRPVFAEICLPLLVQRFGPRLERYLNPVGCDV